MDGIIVADHIPAMQTPQHCILSVLAEMDEKGSFKIEGKGTFR